VPEQTQESTVAADASPVIRSITLGSGVQVHFTVRDIPDPPAASFAHDIPRLNGMWDDTSEHWIHWSVLVMAGHPIPLVYWPQVYRYGKTDQWKGTKSKWYEWKVTSSLFTVNRVLKWLTVLQVMVERWRTGTPDQFWSEFSHDDGHHMHYTPISAVLRRQRRIADEAMAAHARAEYGESFPQHFTYRRGNEVHVMTKPSAIAKHYRSLHSVS